MLVASDLNGTLTTESPILAVARWVKKNQPESYPVGFTLSLFVSYMQVKLGLMAIDTWGDINMRRVLKLVLEPNRRFKTILWNRLWMMNSGSRKGIRQLSY